MAVNAKPDWPPSLEMSCGAGWGMCVSLPHRLIIVSTRTYELGVGYRTLLEVYSLADGTLIRTIPCSRQLEDAAWCGLCLCPDGASVLVPDFFAHELQIVGVCGDALSYLPERFGAGLLRFPKHVDCNSDIVVVSEYFCHRVTILSWPDGELLARCGGALLLKYPLGLRLTRDGKAFVVVDSWNNRLRVFGTGLTGQFLYDVGIPSDFYLADVIIQPNKFGVSPRGVAAMSNALGDGGVVHRRDRQVQVFFGMDMRRAWLAACVTMCKYLL